MNTRNTFLIAAIAASLAAVNADAIEDPDSSELEFNIPRIEVNRPKQKQDGLPSPGIYRSEPHLSIVIVPESVDPAFEKKLGADMQMDDNVIRPPTHLEPYRPDR